MRIEKLERREGVGFRCKHGRNARSLFTTMVVARNPKVIGNQGDEEEMERSLKKLRKLRYDVLAPGHD